MGLPVDETGGRGGMGARAAGASGADAAGAAGAEASGVSGAVGATEGGAAGAGASRRGPALPDDEMTRLGAAGRGCSTAGAGVDSGAGTAGVGSTSGVSVATGAGGATEVASSASSVVFFAAAFFAGAFLAADFFAAVFLAGASGSSGWTSRTSPSRSALRRTRSAWASTTLEEWLFTPIPSATHRSKVSLFVRPSSRASSYTRMLDGNCYLNDCGSGPTQRDVEWARPAMTTPRNGSPSSHGTGPGEE